MRPSDLCSVFAAGAEGWNFSFTCALCVWICYYIAHCYCEGGYTSFDKAAGKRLFCHCNIKESGMFFCMPTNSTYCLFSLLLEGHMMVSCYAATVLTLYGLSFSFVITILSGGKLNWTKVIIHEKSLFCDFFILYFFYQQYKYP